MNNNLRQLEQDLEAHFSPQQAQLLEDFQKTAYSPWSDDETLTQRATDRVDSELSVFTTGRRSYCVQALSVLQDTIAEINKQLPDIRALLTDLQEKRRHALNHKLSARPPKIMIPFYFIFYLVIMAGAGKVIQDTIKTIYPDFSSEARIFLALLAPATSFILTHLYLSKNQTDRKPFQRKVYLWSILTSLSTSICYGIAYFATIWLVSNPSTGGLFSTGFDWSNFVNTIQITTSTIALVTAFLTEAAFSSALMLKPMNIIGSRFKVNQPKNCVDCADRMARPTLIITGGTYHDSRINPNRSPVHGLNTG